MSGPRVHALLRELEGAHEALERALEGITPRELYTPPKEGEWSVAQVLAHTIEMEPFWLRKVLLARQQEAPTLARATEAEREQRLRAVAEHGQDSLPVILSRMAEAHAEAVSILLRLDEADLARPCVYQNRRMTVQAFIESVARHLREHEAQIRATREALATPGQTAPAR
ncbi:MAG: DinB family protein [Dehalococcoidia bacterium]|nr:DinB family protein [Dehalococcoidia bacterium]MDW8120372.1 DinB family protein [Chloroflexota bacterium]